MAFHRGWRRGFLLLLAVLAVLLSVTAAVWAAAVRICPRCGHEQPPDARVCSHCGEVSRPAAVPDEAGRTEEPAAAAVSVDVVMIREEIARAVGALEGGDGELARLFLKNATAWRLLSDVPLTDASVSESIVALLARCDVASGVRRKCAVCGGTGKTSAELQGLDGTVRSLSLHTQPCTACGGSGTIVSPAGVDEQRLRMGDALRRYRTIQQNRHFVPVGGAWVPAAVEPNLSVRQKVMLKRATAAPCPDCGGLGKRGCAKCNGSGWVACPNRKCSGGVVTSERETGFSRTPYKWREKCTTCGGTGRIGCSECGGRGFHLCDTCGATGDRPPCRACSGEGIQACRRCKGSGLYKGEPCTVCAGQGYVECAACGGDGRKR